MFNEKLREKFKENEPIFTKEILELFPEYSRAQVFRYINKAEEEQIIKKYVNGIYFIPKMTEWGQSTITPDKIIEKKYIGYGDDVYGVYAGIKLLNMFSITTQMAATVEVVTNNESSRCRNVTIKNRKFILRKSRCKITHENSASYMVMQLFDEFTDQTKLDDFSKSVILKYISDNKVTRGNLLNMSLKFPDKTVKYLIGSGIIDEIA